MGRLRLNFACGLYDRMVPLLSGEVRPEGIDLNFIVNDDPRDVFDRMSARAEFDVAELSASEYITRHVANDPRFVAIPVFPSRMFRHGLITINARSGIKAAKDLEGRRVGVPLYTMTAAVWIRGHLAHEYGVDLSKISWVEGGINAPGTHGNPTVLPMAVPTHIERNTSTKTMSELMAAGEVDAIIGTRLPTGFRTNPDLQRLFPNYRQIEQEYYRRTKIFPIMHLIAIRREIYEANSFIATSLYKAFSQAKNIALNKMKSSIYLRYMLPWMPDDLDEIEDLFEDGDPWPYGIEENRETLEALCDYMHEQGLIASRPNVDDLFLPVGHVDWQAH